MRRCTRRARSCSVPAGTITMAGGNCADVIGDDTGTNGSAVDSWSCLSTAVDQHWTHNANGSLETLGRCLGISTAPGAGGTGTGVAGDHATLWDCNGSGVEQWVQRPDGTLYNPPSGLCLYGQPANGYQLLVTACNGSDPAQQFFVYDNGAAVYGNGLAPPAGTITMAGGNCADVIGDDTGTNGSAVDSWSCLSTAVDQHWTHNANGSLETLGRCLGISTAPGAGGTGTGVAGDHATLWDCNGSGVEQWVQRPDGTLYNPPSGLCLYGQPANGYQLLVTACNASDPDQQFSVNGGSPVTNNPSGMCVDVIGDDTGTNGTPIDMWGCQSSAVDQHWAYNPAAQTLETLGRCLGISTAQGVGGTGTGVAGDHATLWDCNGSGVEQWKQQPDGTLLNPPSGLCLYGQPANGYQLLVTACNGSDPAQQFFVYDNGADVIGDDTGTNGSAVDSWSCLSTAVDQHWTHNANGSLETLGRCLGISTAPGARPAGTRGRADAEAP